MADLSGFLVEDFIQSITAQLDRVQDVLRLKAQTRPLTYALKDFALDLNVFVDMDEEGNVRFRSSSPNETGASLVRLGFTTITKPMIEENTVALAMTTSPTLDELGLAREEQRRLAQLGVRNAAQLQQLRRSTGTATIARYTGVPADRLRQAMQQGQPFVRNVQPDTPRPPGPPARPPVVAPPARPPVVAPPVRPPVVVPPVRPPVVAPPVMSPEFTSPTAPAPSMSGRREPDFDRVSLVEHPPGAGKPPTAPGPTRPQSPPADPDLPALHVAPDTRRLRLSGGNLINPAGPPLARLAGQPLQVDVLDDDEMLIELPPYHEGGALEITLPHGETYAFALGFEPLAEAAVADDASAAEGARPAVSVEFGPPEEVGQPDPWQPQEGEPL